MWNKDLRSPVRKKKLLITFHRLKIYGRICYYNKSGWAKFSTKNMWFMAMRKYQKWIVINVQNILSQKLPSDNTSLKCIQLKLYSHMPILFVNNLWKDLRMWVWLPLNAWWTYVVQIKFLWEIALDIDLSWLLVYLQNDFPYKIYVYFQYILYIIK